MNKYNLNNSYKAVVIGGSAGSFQGIVKILSQLPKGFPLPMRIRLFLLGKKIDYSAHDQNAPGATWKHGTPLARHMATTLFRSSNTATRRRRS